MGRAFLIKTTDYNKFYFILRDDTNELILKGKPYKTRQECRQRIEAVRSQSLRNANYDRHNDKKGRPKFHINSREDEIIAEGGPFISREERARAIETIKECAPCSPIIDRTLN